MGKMAFRASAAGGPNRCRYVSTHLPVGPTDQARIRVEGYHLLLRLKQFHVDVS